MYREFYYDGQIKEIYYEQIVKSEKGKYKTTDNEWIKDQISKRKSDILWNCPAYIAKGCELKYKQRSLYAWIWSNCRKRNSFFHFHGVCFKLSKQRKPLQCIVVFFFSENFISKILLIIFSNFQLSLRLLRKCIHFWQLNIRKDLIFIGFHNFWNRFFLEMTVNFQISNKYAKKILRNFIEKMKRLIGKTYTIWNWRKIKEKKNCEADNERCST